MMTITGDRYLWLTLTTLSLTLMQTLHGKSSTCCGNADTALHTALFSVMVWKFMCI